MKVEQVKAFKSNNGCIFETEQEAIECNVSEILDKAQISTGMIGDSYTMVQHKLKLWVRDNKKDIKYLLANIDKII